MRNMGMILRELLRPFALCFVVTLLFLLTLINCAIADVSFKYDYQDPAGDVLEFNETWHEVGAVDSQPQIDIKWLRSANDTKGNVVLRLEFKNHQTIDVSNKTKHAFRIFTKKDNSTGYNITFQNGSAVISSFNNTFEEDMTSNISIIYDKGEVLTVKISKNKYLKNITHFNIDAYTWKEQGNWTYIDYVSVVPGHPGATGTIVVVGSEPEDDPGLLGLLCSIQFILIAIVILVIIIIIVILVKR